MTAKSGFSILLLILSSAVSAFSPKLPRVKPSNIAENTFIFWVNGDADRFRNEQGVGSKVVRLDTLDVAEIKRRSKKCQCNVVLFHDQRGTDTWLTRRKFFGAFLYAFSNGREVNLKDRWHFRRQHLSFKEVDQSEGSFLTGLLKFSGGLFPRTKYHLVYRGHSFATPLNSPSIPFDLSSKGAYHFDKFVSSIKKSGASLSSITFAACSMSYAELAVKLIPYGHYLIASQVNVHETGLSGFSFRFLEDVRDGMTGMRLAESLAQRLLEKFRTVKERELYIRETPVALVDLRAMGPLKTQMKEAMEEATKAIKADPASFKDEIITSKVSQRYLESREAEGMPSGMGDIVKKKLQSTDGNETAYDFLGVLRKVGRKGLADEIGMALMKYDYTDFSQKEGLSMDVTFH